MLLTTANFVTRRREKTKAVKSETDMAPCNTELALKPKTEPNFFQFPEVRKEQHDSLCTSGYGSLENCSTSPQYPCVAIETEGFYLSVDPFFYDVKLKQCDTPSSSCTFRKVVLHTDRSEEGTTETVLFYLNDNEQHFLTTTADKQLEINMFNGDLPALECPDERFFTVFTTPAGQTLIQPVVHKGHYFHHLDDKLTVRPLDLNWRAPEEYFFHFTQINIEVPSEKLEQSAKHSVSESSEPKVEIIRLQARPIPAKSKFKMADLIFGCFSDRSKRLVA